jgi:hypothetical protein
LSTSKSPSRGGGRRHAVARARWGRACPANRSILGAWLPDHDLSGLGKDYGLDLASKPPICERDASGRFTTAPPHPPISQKPMPVQLNLWLYEGHPPVNSQSVEVIVRSFTFTPKSY